MSVIQVRIKFMPQSFRGIKACSELEENLKHGRSEEIYRQLNAMLVSKLQ